ncbi:prepilin peptidase [Streptomyces marispadix]|uniref:A24 family peptidase n=1 Tax=Streptomyces marispadix TaxID=2922868 RepID=A0ABS9T2K1_9ACTN|nr:A24 family peptidase [Streptomyces marispadix]MCH6162753.1 A24 family peptidase [Streptomyces marispadix]
MPVIVAILALCAAGYGAAAGALLPRAAYRLAVPPSTPPRERCPSGHRLEGPAHGWLGRAHCPPCAASRPPEASEPPESPGDFEPSGPFEPSEAFETSEPFETSTRFFVSVCASVCAVLALSVGVRPELGVWLIATPLALLLASVDARTRRLPDVLTLPLAATTAALLGLAALVPGTGGSWKGALLGGAVLTGAYWLLHLINRRGMGFGDVKLAASVGLALGWYGWDVLFTATLLSFLLHFGYGVTLMLSKRAGWKTELPFGPFMIAGTLAGVVMGGVTA